ncbi:MAG TPA: hypothetical protein VIO60_07300, partial [Rectinemataceae bacterium]
GCRTRNWLLIGRERRFRRLRRYRRLCRYRRLRVGGRRRGLGWGGWSGRNLLWRCRDRRSG